jgi:uncharacterized protein YoxC
MDRNNKNKRDKKSEKNKAHSLYVLKLETKLHNLELREEAATRRMQLLVYPAAIAFTILSAYGFYLVNTLTKDVSHMADSVEVMNQSVKKNMHVISANTSKMSHHMDGLITNMEGMNTNVTNLALTTYTMSHNVEQMSVYTGHIQQDLWHLNKSISKPLSLLNTLIPWGDDARYRYSSYSLASSSSLVQQPTQPGSLGDVAAISASQ